MKNELIYIQHIYDAIKKIEKYKPKTKAKFSSDEKTQDACIRQFEIIGEAASKLTKSFQEKYKVIPWKEIIGMRHKLIHDYFGVDIDLVWNTIIVDLPKLKKQIKELIPLQ